MTVIRDSQGRGIDVNNPLNVKVNGLESNSIQPVDIQSHYMQMVQTHSGVIIAPSTSSYGSFATTFIDCDGFDKLAVISLGSVSGSSTLEIYWSTDGVNIHGAEYSLASGTTTGKAIEVPVKARYARVNFYNAHTAPITVNAYATLKA